jgi:pimeloyl-ACP methyl ester carboxylesterase
MGALTRRQLLLGAAGCGVSGLLGPRSGARIEAGFLHSRTVDHPVGWMTSLPNGARSAEGLPLVVCLPGRGGGARWVDRALYVQDYAAHVGFRAAFAAVDSGESYWHHRRGGEDRLAMLFDEALPLFQRRLGTPATRAIMGWSMGGYGALLAAETRPRAFAAVAVASPAIWTSYAAQHAAVPDAFDSQADYDAHDVLLRLARLRDVPVRVDIGDGDPFLPGVRILRQRKHTAGGTQPGCHDLGYWRSVAPTQLTWLKRVLA